MENLSTILSRLMSEKGIKSAELARKVGVGQPVIYRLMMGATENPQVLTLKPIADFFGITLDQLLGFTPLTHQKPLSHTTLHDLNNKLITAKTIASVLVDLLPTLIEAYSKAVSAKQINESIPEQILPLLSLNAANLVKAISQVHEIINGEMAWEK